jgi:WD40 repeat protein
MGKNSSRHRGDGSARCSAVGRNSVVAKKPGSKSKAGSEVQARIAESRRIAAESSSALIKYPQQSLLLAVEAVKAEQSLHGVRAAAAEQSLREALGFAGGRSITRSTASIEAVAISPDNHWLVTTGSFDKTARLWLLQINALVDLARTIVGRNFSTNEWQLYFPGEAFHKTFPELPGPD